MFKRRQKRSFSAQLREIFWPRMGWKRLAQYFHLRLIRLNATPAEIARGLSFGLCISFVPLPGTHMITAVLLSKLTRGNVLACLLGTLAGNPWTFPPMWWLAYQLGRVLFELAGVPVADMPDKFVWDDLMHEVKDHPFELIIPWVTGGAVLGAGLWPFSFYFFRRLVIKSRQNHSEQRAHRMAL